MYLVNWAMDMGELYIWIVPNAYASQDRIPCYSMLNTCM